MRIGELLAIKTDNINIENKTLEIDGTINRTSMMQKLEHLALKKQLRQVRVIEQ